MRPRSLWPNHLGDRLSISLDQYGDYEKKEKCGLFGIWGTPEASAICYQGIFAQNHRGQESAGMVVSDGINLSGNTGMGLVGQVFTPRLLNEDKTGTVSSWPACYHAPRY